MYQIAVMPNCTDANLSLSFKTKEAADTAWEKFDERSGAIDIIDDYGYRLSMNRSAIAYFLFIDIEQSQLCQHEKNIAVAKAGRKLAAAVNDDPEVAALLGVGSGRNSSLIQ